MATLPLATTPKSDIKTAENFIPGYDVNQAGKQVFVSPGYTPGVSATPVTAETTITADSLNPVAPIKVATVDTPPPSGISGIDYTPTPEVMTTPETDVQKRINDIMAGNELIAGKSAYQAGLEKADTELAAQRKIESDYSAQLKTLQAEAKNIENRMQLGAEGRGITAAGLAPITASELRRNSIAANTVGAILAATQGKIAYSQSLIDKAVSDKFTPLEDAQKAKIANLEMIMKSPEYTIAEKNRASAQKLIEEKRTADIATQKANEAGVLSVATEAAKNGADSSVIEQIRRAGSELEAVQIATQAGVYTTPEKKAIQDKLTLEGYTLLNPSDLSEYTENQILRMSNGDIFLKPVEEQKFTTKNITVGSGKTSKELLITYDENGREVAREMLSGGGAGGGGTGEGGGGGVVSGQTQAIIDNPSLFDDLTNTNKGKVISELQANGYDTSNLGVKGLSDTAISTISQSQKALSDLVDLRQIIVANKGKIGPIKGLEALNPWSEKRKVQADIDRVRQTVGKALEGGVLRKEDEEKYKKILTTITDVPETALYKLDALQTSIQRDLETYKQLQGAGGRSIDTKASLQKKAENESKPEDLRNKYNY